MGDVGLIIVLLVVGAGFLAAELFLPTHGILGVIGGLGGGLLSSAFGLASVFWLSAACAVVATGCAWRLRALDHRP